MTRDSQWRAVFFLVTATLCWGLNANFSKLAVGEISPMQVVTLRWLGVVLLMLIFAREQVRRDWPSLRPHLPFLALMGGCGFTLFNALFYIAGHHTSAINIGILQGAVPIFVLVGGFIAFGQRIGLVQTFGVMLTLVGVIVVATGGNWETLARFTFNRGDLLMLAACLLYALYSLGLVRSPRASPLGLFTVMAQVAWVVSLPLVIVETWIQGWQPPTTRGWIIVALITLLPSLLAQVFYILGVKLIGPARASTFYNLVPVFAAVLAVIMLGEIFELHHALALALVLGGIWLSEIGKAEPVR